MSKSMATSLVFVSLRTNWRTFSNSSSARGPHWHVNWPLLSTHPSKADVSFCSGEI